MKFVIYPNLCSQSSDTVNPYIKDFIKALESCGQEVCNKPHKNPLVSIVFPIPQADVYVFHWIENVPAYKHGYIQFFLACFLVVCLKLRRKKIVWFLHNKKPHDSKKGTWKKFLMWMMTTLSDRIITHAKEGKKVVEEIKKASVDKVKYICHPTKNRMNILPSNKEKKYDFLIWGTISVYKGTYELLKFLKEKDCSYRVKIIGLCSSKEYWDKLLSIEYEHVDMENRSVSFEELANWISISKYVMVPYQKDTVLSSAILMDSLSFGATVIGPDTGSFSDLAEVKTINVFTFSSFDEIDSIVQTDVLPKEESYLKFLTENDWAHFVHQFIFELGITV